MLLSRPALIIAMSSLFLALASTHAISDTISIGALSTLYKPLKFTHDKHMEIESNCSVCHHNSAEGTTPKCGSCHGALQGEAKNRTITGLKDAYHGRCIGCHKRLSGPIECAGCHNKKNRELNLLSLKTISNIYGPANFSHGKHIDAVSDCALCHHQAEGNNGITACKECHEAAPVYTYKGADRKNSLGLKGAYHGLCVSCHKKTAGPVDCAGCHQRNANK